MNGYYCATTNEPVSVSVKWKTETKWLVLIEQAVWLLPAVGMESDLHFTPKKLSEDKK
jgi:hypothetical protein